MDEMRNAVVTPEEELIDLLLEFSIVALCLAQKVSRTMKDKQNKEGGNGYEQSKRVGSGNQGSAFRCRHY